MLCALRSPFFFSLPLISVLFYLCVRLSCSVSTCLFVLICFPFALFSLFFSFQPQRTLFTNVCFYSKNVLLLSLFLPLKTLKKSSFLLLFPLLLPLNSPSVAAPKGLCFRLFYCDNLIEWNIKCVIFRAKKEAKKTKKRFNVVEFSMKGILMFVNENERNRVTNKPINSKIKLKTNTIYNVIGVFFDNFAL